MSPNPQDLTLLSGRDVVLSLWYSDSESIFCFKFLRWEKVTKGEKNEFSLFTYLYTCSVIHVTRICCFKFCYLKSSFGYLENSLLWISLSPVFEKDREFFALNPTKNLWKFKDFSWKICENKGWLSANFVCITFVQYCMFQLKVSTCTIK